MPGPSNQTKQMLIVFAIIACVNAAITVCTLIFPIEWSFNIERLLYSSSISLHLIWAVTAFIGVAMCNNENWRDWTVVMVIILIGSIVGCFVQLSHLMEGYGV